MLAGRQVHLAHDARVPDARPAFVHDLGLELRDEIFHLLVQHRHDIALPGFKRRRLLHYEIDKVLFGYFETRFVLANVFSTIDTSAMLLALLSRKEIVVAAFAAAGFFIGLLVLILAFFSDEEIRIYMFFYRKRRIEKLFDHLSAVLEFVLAHSARVQSRFVHHSSVGLREINVVLEEVDVTQHVGDHHLVLSWRVGLQQKRVRGVRIDDDFVYFRQAEVVHHLHAMVRLAKRPMRVAAWQSIGADFVHDRSGNDLETHRKRIEPKSGSGNFPDLLDRFFEFLYFPVNHIIFYFLFSIFYFLFETANTCQSKTTIKNKKERASCKTPNFSRGIFLFYL